MKKITLIFAVLFAFALLAGACNGHSQEVHDQEWIEFPFTFEDHNHLAHEDWQWAHDIAWVKWGTNWQGWDEPGNNTYGVKVCTIGITASETDPLNDFYGQTLKCKDHVEGWLQGNAAREIEVDNLYFLSPSGYERVAYESYVVVYDVAEDRAECGPYFGTVCSPALGGLHSDVELYRCEYHDPDGSNPSFCPGRDLNGDL